MPRPKPLVSLHGAVNFDRLVPFDAAANAPPLAANDILVMRRAGGGDNKTLSIGDITATGAVNIAQLLGGANDDMLFRVAGVWTGTGPTGLTYDGSELVLDGNDLAINSGGNIEIDDAGNIEIVGTGGIEINGGGGIMITADGGIEIDSADGQLILTGGAEMLFEGGSGITLENGAAIAFDGDGGIDFDGGAGDIVMGTGQIRARDGSTANLSYTFLGDLNTGLYLQSGADIVGIVGKGIDVARADGDSQTFQIIAGSLANPGLAFIGDVDTGLFNVSPDHFELVAGGQTVARVREVGNVQFQLKPQSSFQNSPGEPLLQFHNSALGFYVPSANIISLAVLGAQTLSLSASGFETHGGGGSGPIIRNVGSSGSVPTIIPNKADLDTGLTRSGINQSSIVNGGVEALRVRATTASIAAHTNLFVFDYDNGQLEIVSVGAADSGGAGFKLLRIAN